MAAAVLVDSNVILDVATDDQRWGKWSADMLASVADESILVINPVIYAEVSVGVDSGAAGRRLRPFPTSTLVLTRRSLDCGC